LKEAYGVRRISSLLSISCEMQGLKTSQGDFGLGGIASSLPDSSTCCYEIFECPHGGNGLRATRVNLPHPNTPLSASNYCFNFHSDDIAGGAHF